MNLRWKTIFVDPACIASIIGGSKDGVAQVMYRRTPRFLPLVKIDIHIFSFLAGFKGVHAELEFDTRMVIGYNFVIILVGFYRNTINKRRNPQEALFGAHEMIKQMINK